MVIVTDDTFSPVTHVHVTKVSLSKRWSAKIRWLVMHLANVCTVMTRDCGIVQVIYHMTRHVTIWGTCVLLLVRDKGRAWKALELITDPLCIRVLSYMTDRPY